MIIARIASLTVLAAGLVGGLSLAAFGRAGDSVAFCVCLAGLGGLIGAVTGAAREIVEALRVRPFL